MNWYSLKKLSVLDDNRFVMLPEHSHQSDYLYERGFSVGDDVYIFRARFSPSGGLWVLSFTTDEGDFDETNRRHSLTVFSGVMNCIKQFIADEQPEEMYLSADGTSRVSLYEKMIQRFIDQLGYQNKPDIYDKFNTEKSKSWSFSKKPEVQVPIPSVQDQELNFANSDSLIRMAVLQDKRYEMGDTKFNGQLWNKSFTVGEDIYHFKAKKGSDWVTGKRYWNLSFTDTDGYDNLTNKRQSLTVLSAIMECIKEFISDVNPDTIHFSAYGDSRVSLYQKLIQRYLDQMGFDQPDETDDDKDYHYKDYQKWIINKKPQANVPQNTQSPIPTIQEDSVIANLIADGLVKLSIFDSNKWEYETSEDMNTDKHYGRGFIVDGEKYYFEAYCADVPDNTWDMGFTTGDGSFRETNRKHSLTIFSAIMQIIREFVATKQPSKLEFSGEGHSRVSLYDKMIKRFVKQLGFNTNEDTHAPLPTTPGKDSYKYYSLTKSPNTQVPIPEVKDERAMDEVPF